MTNSITANQPNNPIKQLCTTSLKPASATIKKTPPGVLAIARRSEYLTKRTPANTGNMFLRRASVCSIAAVCAALSPVMAAAFLVIDDQLSMTKTNHAKSIANAFYDIYKTAGEAYESFARICERMITHETKNGRDFFKEISKHGKGKVDYLINRLAQHTSFRSDDDKNFNNVKRRIYEHLQHGRTVLKAFKPTTHNEMKHFLSEQFHFLQERRLLIEDKYYEARKDIYIIAALSLYKAYSAERTSACDNEDKLALQMINQRLEDFKDDLNLSLAAFDQLVQEYQHGNSKDSMDGINTKKSFRSRVNGLFRTVAQKLPFKNKKSRWNTLLADLKLNKIQSHPQDNISAKILG